MSSHKDEDALAILQYLNIPDDQKRLWAHPMLNYFRELKKRSDRTHSRTNSHTCQRHLGPGAHCKKVFQLLHPSKCRVGKLSCLPTRHFVIIY